MLSVTIPNITPSQNTPVLPNMRRRVTRPSGASCSRRNSAKLSLATIVVPPSSVTNFQSLRGKPVCVNCNSAGRHVAPALSVEAMSTSYEDLCRQCFGIGAGRSFEDNIESCGGVIAAGHDRKDVEQAYFRRGLLRAAIGDHVGAIEDYGQAIELRAAPRYFESRGEAYAFKGDAAAALSDFARVVELEPTNSSPHLSIGGIHLGRGDHALAVQSFTRAIELSPAFAVAYYDRYLAYAAVGEWDRSRLDLDRAIELDPEDAIYRTVRGGLYLREGRLDQAIVDFDCAVEGASDIAMCLYLRAVARRRRGDDPGADADFARAREIAPDIDQEMAAQGIIP